MTNHLKYAQQHLANERTYLAWVRTAISVVGVGFLATSLHFTVGQVRHPIIDMLSVLLGITAGMLGIVIILLTTRTYQTKRKQIEAEQFSPTNRNITVLSVLLVVFITLVVIYFVMLVIG